MCPGRDRTSQPLRVGVLYGGMSAEHDVSCASVVSVLRALDPEDFEAVPVGVTREGAWVRPPPEAVVAALAGGVASGEAAGPAIADCLDAAGEDVHLVAASERGRAVVSGPGGDAVLDVVLPVLHGPFGEDGTVQGMLELIGVPYVGSGVLGSAVAMDKVATKRVLEAVGIPVVPYLTYAEDDWVEDDRAPAHVVDRLGLPLFVKPANLGSSVGVSRVDGAEDLPPAVEEALRYDDVVLVETAVEGREIECGVLGNRHPEASVPGEVVVAGGWYDYEAKYLGDTAETTVPADVPPPVAAEIRALACRAFDAVGAMGMARVDFFYDETEDRVWVNEVNTIPGFTAISMYAKMWAATGVPYEDLLERLVELAFDRHRRVARRRAPSPVESPVSPL